MFLDPPGEPHDDATLVTHMVAGDAQAFTALFGRYHAQVYRFARQMSGSRETAEDVTQEAFIALMETGERFDPKRGSVGAYLYGIARNLLRRRLRRDTARAEIDLQQLVEPASSVATPPSVLDDLERAAELASLRRAILSLPPAFREVIVLCDLHDVRYEDAAVIVGCPVGTIRSRLSRARRVLAERCRSGARVGAASGAPYRPRRCLA
jgi:RNA polymerase sigma-70 factor (ECF subfamily)